MAHGSVIDQLLKNAAQKYMETLPAEKRKLTEEEEISASPVKKKKKKRDKSFEVKSEASQNEILKLEPADSSELTTNTNIEECSVKKKKKKKHKETTKEFEEISEVTDNESPIKKRKKKKHNKENRIESEEFSELTDNTECPDKDSCVGKKKKKKKKDKLIKYESMNANDINSDSSLFQNKVKKKKKHKSCKKDIDRIHFDPNSNPPPEYRICDIYSSPDSEIITFQLLNVTNYILSENIPVNLLNAFYTKNYEPNPGEEMRDHLVREYQVIFAHFTEEEDEKIISRLKLLISKGLITDLKAFIEQLNEQNGFDSKGKDKSTRNIVGLYVGQDLQRRLAYSICQRLVFLALGSNIKNKYREKRESEGQQKLRGKPKFWSLDEDQELLEMVLRSRSGKGIIPVEQCVEDKVDWDTIGEKFEEYGRTKKLVRERWNRKLKVMLLENEEDTEAVFGYHRSLLEHVAALGVKERKEIRWKEVAKTFHPKTSSALSQDFWNLIRHKKGDNLSDQIFEASNSLTLENTNSRSTYVKNWRVNKMNERKSDLLDFYRNLRFHSSY